jgi:uncharacterized membrane protein YhhN
VKRFLSFYIAVSGFLIVLYSTDILHGKWKFVFPVFNFVSALCCFLLTKKNSAVVFGLFFTVLADFNLVLLEHEPPFLYFGIAFFIVAQCCYFYRLRTVSPHKSQLVDIYTRALLCTVLVICGIIIADNTPNGVLFVLVAVYIAFSFCNITLSLFNIKQNFPLSLGLCLLLACDICIGINYLGTSAPPEWHLYIPSQMFIVIYSADNPEKIC